MPAFIQQSPIRPAVGWSESFFSISSPIGPSITFSMCGVSRNMNGRLNTFISGTIWPIGPTLMRAMASAPTWACSIISFSPPSCIEGNIWMLRRPWVAWSSFLPMRSTASTVG